MKQGRMTAILIFIVLAKNMIFEVGSNIVTIHWGCYDMKQNRGNYEHFKFYGYVLKGFNPAKTSALYLRRSTLVKTHVKQAQSKS